MVGPHAATRGRPGGGRKPRLAGASLGMGGLAGGSTSVAGSTWWVTRNPDTASAGRTRSTWNIGTTGHCRIPSRHPLLLGATFHVEHHGRSPPDHPHERCRPPPGILGMHVPRITGGSPAGRSGDIWTRGTAGVGAHCGPANAQDGRSPRSGAVPSPLGASVLSPRRRGGVRPPFATRHTDTTGPRRPSAGTWPIADRERGLKLPGARSFSVHLGAASGEGCHHHGVYERAMASP
jgi:hypothetical protein